MDTVPNVADVATNCILYLKRANEVSSMQLAAAQMHTGALDHPVLVVDRFEVEQEVEIYLVRLYLFR